MAIYSTEDLGRTGGRVLRWEDAFQGDTSTHLLSASENALPSRMLKYQDVFVPGGFPPHTYNPRGELNLELRLGEITQNLCKLATVTGQTKSGKTVLARRVLPTDKSVWVDGGGVATEDDFWQTVVEQLGGSQSTQTEAGKSTEARVEGEVSTQISAVVLKGEGRGSAGLSHARTKTESHQQSLSNRVVALRDLRASRRPLIIDDFHYLPKELQAQIIRALKPLVFEGVPVAIIAIPHRRYDALKVEKEMTGRIAPIEIPAWSTEELRFIPETGFRLLNYTLAEETKKQLAEEAIGSPHLMQDFCRGLCRRRELSAAAQPTQIQIDENELEAVFHEVAETIGRPIFEKLARGPQSRSDRIERVMSDGRTGDIYELVLVALAHIRPGLVSIEYEDLRAAVRAVSADEPPQLHEVARVLKHMATIAATDQSSTPVIDFEEDDRKLHITDPYFAFYLRWGNVLPDPTNRASVPRPI